MATFTARDNEIIVAALKAHRNPHDIDFEKMAELAGFKNAGTARACYLPVKKKMEAALGGTSESSSSAKAAKNKGGPKPSGRVTKSTPAKKGKAKARIVKDEESDDAEHGVDDEQEEQVGQLEPLIKEEM